MAFVPADHEISTELAVIFEATKFVGGKQEGGAHVALEVCVKNNPTVGLVPKLPSDAPVGS